MSKYDEASALRALGKKGVKLNFMNTSHPLLGVPIDDPNIGIGTWGKIDFLVHYRGYGWTYIKARKVTAATNDSSKTRKSNTTKRERHAHELTDKSKKRNK